MKAFIIGFILLLICGCSESPERNSSTATPIPAAAKPPDEAAAIRLLGAINQAQADYLRRNRRYALTYDELIESHVLNEDPTKSATGYEINLHPSADAESYTVAATPGSSSQPARYFYTDKTGVIRAEQGKEATSGSPPVS